MSNYIDLVTVQIDNYANPEPDFTTTWDRIDICIPRIEMFMNIL